VLRVAAEGLLQLGLEELHLCLGRLMRRPEIVLRFHELLDAELCLYPSIHRVFVCYFDLHVQLSNPRV